MGLNVSFHHPRRLGTALLRRAQAGFTLIELMIVVAIVAIIASVAYPQYTEYVRRSRLAEGSGLLSVTRVRLEQYFQDNRNYGSTAAVCGVTMPAGDYFTYSCNWGAGGTPQSFLLSATGKASAGMSGYTYTVDHNNLQQTTAFVGASGLPANCWLRRKGDTC
ncbi:MAG: prepilin-type N-terminal cleavage/methylation domain-containing protein [Rubrivivax sp.]|nr:prepilin-type N-terminal cleavage/methylation domain-containing protein [Rubrivivax sp.]